MGGGGESVTNGDKLKPINTRDNTFWPRPSLPFRAPPPPPILILGSLLPYPAVLKLAAVTSVASVMTQCGCIAGCPALHTSYQVQVTS